MSGRVGVFTNLKDQTFVSSVQACDPLLDYGVGVILHNITKHLEMQFLKVGFGSKYIMYKLAWHIYTMVI
jgi:hypothetical protein